MGYSWTSYQSTLLYKERSGKVLKENWTEKDEKVLQYKLLTKMDQDERVQKILKKLLPVMAKIYKFKLVYRYVIYFLKKKKAKATAVELLQRCAIKFLKKKKNLTRPPLRLPLIRLWLIRLQRTRPLLIRLRPERLQLTRLLLINMPIHAFVETHIIVTRP